MPPFHTCRKGFEQEAVTSRSWNSTQEFAGSATSEYSTEDVIWISTDTIMSIFGLTFFSIAYACLALLKRLTLLKNSALVGVGMCVWPVRQTRPCLGVSTINGRSP